MPAVIISDSGARCRLSPIVRSSRTCCVAHTASWPAYTVPHIYPQPTTARGTLWYLCLISGGRFGTLGQRDANGSERVWPHTIACYDRLSEVSTGQFLMTQPDLTLQSQAKYSPDPTLPGFQTFQWRI